MLIINFKAYHESTGKNAIKLANIIDQATKDSPVDVIIAVQALDLRAVVDTVRHVKVIAQHIDGVGYGAHTGHILPEEVKSCGAIGTLLNHSERQLSTELLGETIDMAQAYFPEHTIVCTPTYEATENIERLFDPHKIAFEPPELIGGDISVATSQADIIKKVVDISPERQVLVGAGIKTVEDIKVSLDLGAIGVLVASGVIKAKDPAEVVRSFLGAWK